MTILSLPKERMTSFSVASSRNSAKQKKSFERRSRAYKSGERAIHVQKQGRGFYPRPCLTKLRVCLRLLDYLPRSRLGRRGLQTGGRMHQPPAKGRGVPDRAGVG